MDINARLVEAIEAVRRSVPKGIAPEQIQADIDAAFEDLREEWKKMAAEPDQRLEEWLLEARSVGRTILHREGPRGWRREQWEAKWPWLKEGHGPMVERPDLFGADDPDELESEEDAEDVRLAREEAARGEAIPWEQLKNWPCVAGLIPFATLAAADVTEEPVVRLQFCTAWIEWKEPETDDRCGYVLMDFPLETAAQIAEQINSAINQHKMTLFGDKGGDSAPPEP